MEIGIIGSILREKILFRFLTKRVECFRLAGSKLAVEGIGERR